MGKIVIFGGTFNPFHIGHYEMLTALCNLNDAEKILIVPDKIPPHKECDYIPEDKDRIEMCRIVSEDFDKASLCLTEFERNGKSYTYDTVVALKKEYPNKSFSVVCGADMIATLDTWYNFEKLKNEVSFIAFSRNSDEAFKINVERMRQKGAVIDVLDVKITDISSSSIRKNTVKEYLPQKVYEYIKDNSLYIFEDTEKYEKYRKILKSRLTEKRYHHSLCVADEAMRLAVKYGVDVNKAYLAGLLHDITKNAPAEEHLKIFDTFGIILSEVEKNAQKLWHAMSGAAYIRYFLGIEDEEIIDAVRYHTTAKKDMSPLALILYLADFTSADRDYDDVDTMRKLVDLSLDEAYKYSLSYSIKDLAENGRAIHIDTLAAYNQIMLKGKG